MGGPIQGRWQDLQVIMVNVERLVIRKEDFKFCHSPTQPQHELEVDLIMGRKPPTPTNPPHQELLRHFQAT